MLQPPFPDLILPLAVSGSLAKTEKVGPTKLWRLSHQVTCRFFSRIGRRIYEGDYSGRAVE